MSNVTRSSAPTQVWSMPWACYTCKRFGRVNGIKVTYAERTTDDQIRDALDRAHHDASSGLCHVEPDKVILGRLFRHTLAGKVIFLMREGETGESAPSPWPPWIEDN